MSNVRVLSSMSWTCQHADGRDPYEDFLKINEEIKLYNAKLEHRPQIVVANKMDMPEVRRNLSFCSKST